MTRIQFLRGLLILVGLALLILSFVAGYFFRVTMLQTCRDDLRWEEAQRFKCETERNNLKLDQAEKRSKDIR